MDRTDIPDQAPIESKLSGRAGAKQERMNRGDKMEEGQYTRESTSNQPFAAWATRLPG